MRQWLRHAGLGMAAVLVAAGALAGTARASVVLKSDFKNWKGNLVRQGGEGVDARDKPGWRALPPGSRTSDDPGNPAKEFLSTATGRLTIDLAKAGVNPEQGAFDFVMRRADAETETLFVLHDKDGRTTQSMRIEWEKGAGWGFDPPILQTSSHWYTYSKEAGKLGQPWVPAIPLRVGKGSTFRITIAWGGGGPDSIYIDGRRVDTVVDKRRSFGDILRASATMDLGVETDGELYANPLMSTLLDFRILSEATAEHIEGLAPEVTSVTHNAGQVAGFSGKLVAGNDLGVTVRGTTGAAGTFDVVHYPDVGAAIAVDWRGWGVYPEGKTFYAEGEVNLRDVDGYEVFASQAAFDPAAPGMEPLARLKVGEQRYTLATPEVDKPYYIAVMAVMKDGTRRAVIAPIANQPLAEVEPGVYTGSYKVGWQDHFARAVVIGRLAYDSGATAVADPATFAVDPTLTLAVATEPNELKADEKSQARVTVVVTDANGNPVPDHEVKFQLFTTSQYTGVVGGGAFAEQVGGTVTESSFGKTDLFGKVTATYVAGFAAKTAIIVARDMASNSTGAAWVKTYITATAQLELEPLASLMADTGYEISVTSSDEWLTADGKSTARITALVTLRGKPVEGHRIAFSVASGTGTIHAVKDTTDRSGKARAVYTAGKKIGQVLIMATDTTVDISGSVAIELRSDAPAKIAIKVDPEKLPADGRSTADVSVLVTDINDNPNDGVEVEYAVTEGSGRMREDKGLTDRRGESQTRYVAGNSPGRVSIEITVRSTVPTAEEIAKVSGAALAPLDYDFF